MPDAMLVSQTLMSSMSSSQKCSSHYHLRHYHPRFPVIVIIVLVILEIIYPSIESNLKICQSCVICYSASTSNFCRLQRDGGLGPLHLHGEAASQVHQEHHQEHHHDHDHPQVQDAGQALALLRGQAGCAGWAPPSLQCREPVLGFRQVTRAT